MTPSSDFDGRLWRQFIREKRKVKQEQHKKYALLSLLSKSEGNISATTTLTLISKFSLSSFEIFTISEIWTADQDGKLKELVAQHGMSWTKIGELFRERNGKQCRERWYNHLDPAVNKGEWTLEVRRDDIFF